MPVRPPPVLLSALLGSLGVASCTPADGGAPSGPPLFSDLSEKLPPVPIPSGSLQFDLVCHFTRQFDLREAAAPKARPYRPPNRRDYISHEIIDLERMRYCYANSCSGGKPDAIDAVTPEALITTLDPELLQFYRWDNGIAESRFTYDGRTSIQQGRCRIEPFSGFPKPGPPRVYLREREGTGPHPFVHDGVHPDDEIVSPPA